MAPAGCAHNVSTTGDHDAAAVHTPMLAGYRRPSSAPLAEQLLDKQEPEEQQSAQYWLPSLWLWCRPKNDDDGQAMVTVDWACVRRTCKTWLKNPMNIALLLWLLCVGVSGGMLVLLLLGLLFPTAPARRNGWIETNNQVLNALFTLMSLYQHPALCHHLFLLCRWRAPQDVLELQGAYCKQPAGSPPRRGERLRFHLGVVVALLHLTVGCQYVLCGLYWGYTKSTRPELLEDGFFVLGVLAPVAAAAYTACSPLGKSDQPPDLFLVSSDATGKEEHANAAAAAVVVVVEPEWAGDMFDLAGDPAAAALSTSCTFCVLGWNAERLGFGNRYVHAATFALLCFAPLWVLGVAALHITDYVVGDAVGGAGVALCACGLLYGGYWRIQMRRRFGLPGSTACCGSKSLTDYARWLFCWPCALAQEVRTASLYHVQGDTFYYHSNSSKVVVHGDDDDHEGGRQPLLKCTTASDSDSATTVVAASPPVQVVVAYDEAMVPPPVQALLLQVEDDDRNKSDDGSVVLPHGEIIVQIDSSIPVSVTVREEDESFGEDADQSISSDGSWKVEKVKKLINVVTLVSLLILMYTRGFIR